MILSYCFQRREAFFIPWLGSFQKPICRCILQEQGLYNFRKVIIKLNDESSKLTPMEKLYRRLTILVQLLSAVDAMEDAGILHRDIKPENVRTNSCLT